MTEWKKWYKELKKPSWTPKGDTISTIWMVLYPIIAISYGIVFYQAFTGEVSWLVTLPFFCNLILNIAFTPLFFVKEDIGLATLDIYFVLITLLWAIVVIYPYNPAVAFAQIPYALWIIIATIIQTYIWRNNS